MAPGVTVPQPTRKHLNSIRNARAASSSAKHCGMCGHPFTITDPVWRIRMMAEAYNLTAACCQSCAESPWSRITFRPPKPCEGCGRPVHQQRDRIERGRVVCCTDCNSKARSRSRHSQKVARRGLRTCPTCKEEFAPARADAIFCTSPCRQKAYRGRYGSESFRAESFGETQ